MTLTADRLVGFLSKVERSCVRNKMQILSNRRRAVKPVEENSDVSMFSLDSKHRFILPAGHLFSYQDQLNSFISQLNEKTCHAQQLLKWLLLSLNSASLKPRKWTQVNNLRWHPLLSRQGISWRPTSVLGLQCEVDCGHAEWECWPGFPERGKRFKIIPRSCFKYVAF